eukprot:SAG11_NODE_4459_length_1888_cov_1.320291_4_plen_61_part_00
MALKVQLSRATTADSRCRLASERERALLLQLDGAEERELELERSVSIIEVRIQPCTWAAS